MAIPFFKKFKIVNAELLDAVRRLRFPEETFEKFNDPNHPEYGDYKDRQLEEAHDRGYNNAIESVLRILES